MTSSERHIRIEFGNEVGVSLVEGEWNYQVPSDHGSPGEITFESQLYFDVGTTVKITLFGFTENQVKVHQCTKKDSHYEVEVHFTQLHPDAKLLLEQMDRLRFMLEGGRE